MLIEYYLFNKSKKGMMMSDFFAKTFYENTVSQWFIAFLLIALSAVAGRVLYWISVRMLKPLTKKTKTKVDDLLFDLCEEPLVLTVVLAGFWYSLNTLTLGDNIILFKKHAFFAAVVFNIAWLLVRVSDAFIKEYLTPITEKTENDLDDQLLPIARKAMRLIIWSTAVVVGLNNAGYNVGALIAGLGVGGLAFALAAKDSIANLFGGLTVILDKPFKMGDRIKMKGYDGTVIEIGLRSTKLQTLDGRKVTIPNADFASDPIENVSSEPNRKVVLNLGLTYDTTPERVERAMEILKEIAANNSSLEEKVILSFNAFGDFSLNVMFIYYIKSGEDIAGTQTQIDLAILKAFNAEKLEFAFPTQMLYKKEV